MTTSLFMMSLFVHMEVNVMIIVSMLLFVTFYEFGIGTITFIHIFETNVDSMTGFANQVLFFMIFMTTLFSPTLINTLKVTGTFILFGTISLIAFFYILVLVRDTSKRETVNPDGSALQSPPQKTAKKIIEFNEK